MKATLNNLLKRDSQTTAGVCFLIANLIHVTYWIINPHILRLFMASAFTIVGYITLRWARSSPASLRCGRYLVILAVFLFAPAVHAQSPSPSPGPTLQPQPTPSWEQGKPSAQIANLLVHVRELIPYIRRQIERPMLKKFQTLAMILGSLVLLFSFIRVIRENEGANTELYYWFGRAAIFMAFFAIAPAFVSTLYNIGRTLTIPLDNSIEEKRQAFDTAFDQLIHGTVIIRNDQPIQNDPIYWQEGEKGWIAILTDRESGDGKLQGLEELEKSTDLTSWKMPKLFFGLNVSRGILQCGEVFLLLLTGFIMIGLRLAAPFMCAVAIDKKLAERITYPYLWGTVVFSLIFPLVRDILIYIAYTVGAFGLMMYKGEAIYQVDPRTLELVKTSPYDPTLVIIISFVLMTITGLMLWLSPYLSYRIATGQVFEAVSSTASGWAAALVGSAIEFAGLKAGASLQRQAENTQTQAGWQAEMTRAKGTLEVSNLGAQARKVSSLAQIQGGLQGQLGAIWGGAATGRGMALAGQNFTIASIHGQVGDSNRQVLARRDQNIQQAQYQMGNDAIRQAGESYARKEEIFGQYFTAVPMVGVIPASQMAGYANTDRTRTNNAAINNTAIQTGWNETATAERVVKSQNTYQGDMEVAAKEQYKANVAAIDQGAGMAAGGAQRGAATASAGVNKSYDLEMQGNQIQFDTTRSAAGTIRDAGLNAARMRELSTIISGVARDMDRRIEEGMRQRY